jgi:hypothetical protein
MPELFAIQSDLEESLGRALTGAEEPKAQAALRYASNLVRAHYPAVDLLTAVPNLVVTRSCRSLSGASWPARTA